MIDDPSRRIYTVLPYDDDDPAVLLDPCQPPPDEEERGCINERFTVEEGKGDFKGLVRFVDRSTNRCIAQDRELIDTVTLVQCDHSSSAQVCLLYFGRQRKC